MTHESTAAWRELLATLGDLDRGPSSRATVRSPTTVTSPTATACSPPHLGVAFDTYLFPEPGRPQFVAVNTPFRRDRRWGGDNTDAYYFICPVDPTRRYRISGNKGDSVYFSVTAYNEPSPGAWSDRVVAIIRDTDLDIDADGNFSFEFPATPDAAVLMTRDYQADPLTGRPVSWQIEALDEPDPIRHGDAETAAQPAGDGHLAAHHVRHRSAGRRNTSRRQSTPSGTKPPMPQTNSPTPIRCPTPTSAGRRATPATPTAVSCSTTTKRWSSRTGLRRAGSGTWWCGTSSWPPTAPQDARCSINGHSAVLNSDGSVTIVLSRGMTAHPNSLTALGYPRGNLAFRWFLADGVPQRPEVELVKIIGRADRRVLNLANQLDGPAQGGQLGIQRVPRRIQPHGIHAGVSPDGKSRPHHLLESRSAWWPAPSRRLPAAAAPSRSPPCQRSRTSAATSAQPCRL